MIVCDSRKDIKATLVIATAENLPVLNNEL